MKKKTVIFRGRLLGDLKGFDDNTVFTLEDGSWWLQVDGFSRQAEAASPEAELWQEKGACFLHILDNKVRVKPLTNAFRDRIKGAFTGWEDGRQYTLTCGRTFRQACFGFEYAYAESPEAVVADLDGVTMMFVCGTAMEVVECGLTEDRPGPALRTASPDMTKRADPAPDSPIRDWVQNCVTPVPEEKPAKDSPAHDWVQSCAISVTEVDPAQDSPVRDWLVSGRDLYEKEEDANGRTRTRKRFRLPARYEKSAGDLAPGPKSQKPVACEVEDPDVTDHNRKGAGVLSVMLVLLLILAVGVPVAVFGGVGAYKYAKDADSITLGLSPETVHDMTYTETEETLRKAGFTNIETNNISDLDVSEADRENKVGSMVINNSEEYTEDSRYPSYVAIVINYHTLREISPSLSAKDAKGGSYEEIASQLESDGFVNIRYEVIEDLITGWLVKDGQVEEVTINEEKDFKADSVFRQDAEVVIRYHTFGDTFGGFSDFF